MPCTVLLRAPCPPDGRVLPGASAGQTCAPPDPKQPSESENKHPFSACLHNHRSSVLYPSSANLPQQNVESRLNKGVHDGTPGPREPRHTDAGSTTFYFRLSPSSNNTNNTYKHVRHDQSQYNPPCNPRQERAENTSRLSAQIPQDRAVSPVPGIERISPHVLPTEAPAPSSRRWRPWG